MCCLFAAAPLWGQSASQPAALKVIPPDEVRIRTRPYAPPSHSEIRVNADLVLLRVVVRDKAGKPVGGLQKEDFEVRDRNKPQSVSVFREETVRDAPAPAAAETTGTPPARPEFRNVGIFFDDMNLPLSDLVPARQAAEHYVKGGMWPGDRVALFTSSAGLVQEFTTEKEKLLERIAELRTQMRRADDGPGACPKISILQAFQISQQRDAEALNLAVEQALLCPAYLSQGEQNRRDIAVTVERQADFTFSMAEQYSQRTLNMLKRTVNYLARMPGKRVLLLTSSGFWTRSLKQEQEQVIARAVDGEIVINSLDAKGVNLPGINSTAGAPPVLMNNPHLQYAADRFEREQMEAFNDPMTLFAQGTGGRFIHNTNDLIRGLADLAAPPEVSYVLGFVPETLIPDGSFHRLTVRLPEEKGGHSISTRQGYFAPTKLAFEKRLQKDPFDDVVQDKTALTEIPVGVTTQTETSEEGEPLLRVVVRVGIKELPFQLRDGRHRQRLRGLFRGRPVSGRQPGADRTFAQGRDACPPLAERIGGNLDHPHAARFFLPATSGAGSARRWHGRLHACPTNQGAIRAVTPFL